MAYFDRWRILLELNGTVYQRLIKIQIYFLGGLITNKLKQNKNEMR